MDEKHIKSLVDCLLKPLGICLCYGTIESSFQHLWWIFGHQEKLWHFKCIENGGICKGAIDKLWSYVCHKHISDIWIALKNEITAFAIPNGNRMNPFNIIYVENPCYRKTLEELLIMKDLMEDNNGQ